MFQDNTFLVVINRNITKRNFIIIILVWFLGHFTQILIKI